MSKAKKQGFPPAMGLIEVQKIREEYRYVLMKRALKGSIKKCYFKNWINNELNLSCSLGQRVVEDEFLPSYMKFANSADGLSSILRFASYLHLPVDHPKVVELFHIFDSVMNSRLDLLFLFDAHIVPFD